MTVRVRIGLGFIVAASAAFLFSSCSDEAAGPSHPLEARFSVAPTFASADAGVVPIAQIRFTLNRSTDSTLARDTVISIPSGADSVSLSLTVPVFTQGETFALRIYLITPTGDTAFRGGPVTVAPTTNGTPPMVPVTLVYSGIGSNAARVTIATKDTSTFFGQSVLLMATALDSGGKAIPGTPIVWTSLDTLEASVPVADTGRVLGGAARGIARIVARLLTGQTDTARVFVQPLASAILADSGTAQSATVDSLLAQPIVARVTASDGLGVKGLVVRFGVQAGAGTLSVDSAVTDSTGRARTTWRLGGVAGAQAVVATTAALSGDTATFTATGTAGTPSVVTPVAGDSQSAAAGTAVATAPSIEVQDAQGNPVPGVSVEFAVTQGGGSVTGATTTTDAAGTASVGSWTLGSAVGTNTLVAQAIYTPLAPPVAAPTSPTDTLAPPTRKVKPRDARGSRLAATAAPTESSAGGADTLSVTFTANAVTGAASKLVFSTQPPTSATAAAPFSVAVQVRDAVGNVLTGDNSTSVTLAIATGTGTAGAVLGGTVTQTVTAGIATFNSLTVDLAGTGYQLTASASGLASATSNAFDISTGVVASITVTPATRAVASLGDTAQFAAVARDAGGNVVSAAAFTWSLSDSAVASVSSSGIVTAVANGTTYVRATAGGVTDSAALTIAQVPAALTFTQQPSSAIPFSAEVSVLDARGNVATNDNTTSVSLALSGGTAGAVLSGTTTATASAGIVGFTNLTVDLVGTGYQLTANATGLTAAVSAPFDATVAVPSGTNNIWLGSVSTDWATAANWSAGTVPDATKNVWIKAGTPFQPVIAANATTSNLILQTGASVTIDTTIGLAVSGNLDAGYSSIRGPGVLVLSGSGATASGKVPDVTIAGTYTLGDSLVVTSNLIVTGGLNFGGHRAAVAKNFTTSGSGTITMANANDSLVVDSVAAFGGGSTSGLLTAGKMIVGGDFIEGGGASPAAFAPSGTHVTIFNGTGAQTVVFADPGAASSHFNGLTLSNTAGVNFSTDVVSNGLFVSAGDPLVAAGRVTLTAGGLTAGTGSRLSIPWLQIPGTLNSDPTAFSTVDTVVFSGATQTIPDSVPLKTVYVTGTGVSFPGTSKIDSLGGALHIVGGTLTLNGQHVVVADSLFVGAPGNATGQLVMTNAKDTLTVDSTAIFQGAATAGNLSAGVLELRANFVQLTNGGSGANFAPTGTHLTYFDAFNPDFPQTISFGSPGTSYFNDVLAGNFGAGEQLLTDVSVNGAFTANDALNGSGHLLDVTGNLTATIISAGHLITHAAFQVDSTLYGTSYSVDTTEYAGTGQTVIGLPYTNLLVSGSATFTGTTTLGGFLHVGPSGSLATTNATDVLTVPGDILADGGGVTGPGTISATGTGVSLRGTFPNLDIQAGADVQVIGTATASGSQNQYVDGHLSFATDGQPSVLKYLDPTAYLYLNGPQVSMHEDSDTLFAAYHIEICSTPTDTSVTGGVIATPDLDEDCNGFRAFGSNKVLMTGSGAHYMTFYNTTSRLQNVEVSGQDTVSVADMTIGGNLTASQQGAFDFAGSAVTIGGNLVTQNSGVIVMTSSSDNVSVNGTASFGGGDETGLITDGSLALFGDFVQLGTNSTKSFAASGSNLVAFVDTLGVQQTVTFANPDTSGSHFARLQLAQGLQPYPGVALLSDAVASDTFTVVVGNARQSLIGNGHALTVGGLNVNGLDIDHTLLTWTDVGQFSGAFANFLVVHFNNYAPTETQFTVLRSGNPTGGAYIMSNLYFSTLPTDGTGYYVKAEDPVTGDLNQLIVDLGFFNSPTQLPSGETCLTLPTHLDPVSPATILHSCS